MTYQEFLNKIPDVIRINEEFIISDAANPSQPVFNIGKRNSVRKSHATYAIKFFPNKQVCLVWNYKRHRDKYKECAASLDSLSIGRTWDGIQTGADVFYPKYKHLGNKKGPNGLWFWEKVYVVGASHLEKFFMQYQAFMEINSQDEEFPTDIIDDSMWHSESEREKYSSLQFRRDAQFRGDVLNAYGNMCAICRCPVVELLEAAHERNYDVSKTSVDDPEHGICLCANHHLMYDRKLIDIDMLSLEIEVHSEEIKKMPWYSVFVEKYAGKIIQRSLRAYPKIKATEV